ncbi:hypothetical protein BH11PLA2_BH11PLA2_22910 [soil metagenome]
MNRSISLTLIVHALLIGSGCTLYQPRPTTFTIRDGDTGDPIAGAEVAASYQTMLDFGVLLGSIGPLQGTTDSNGQITFIVDPHKYCFRLAIREKGYCRPYARAGHNMQQLKSPRFRYHAEFEAFFYRDPKPEATITLPVGYRGPVIVKFADDEYPKFLNGKRTFEYTADYRGFVTIPDTAIFENDIYYIHAHTADGKIFSTRSGHIVSPAPTKEAMDQVAFRLIDRHSRPHVWVCHLGTDAEADALEKQLRPAGNKLDEDAYRRVTGLK